MKSTKSILLFLSSLLLLGSCVNPDEQQARKSGMEIYFEKTTHNYGEIEVDSDGSYAFIFKNIGEDPIIVNRVRSSCGCTIPEWPREPIEPGKDGKIEVVYNTALSGAFMKKIFVYSSAVNSPTTLVIKGKVTEPKVN